MYVCVCQGVTDSQIRAEVNAGATSMRDLRNRLGVASQCGACGKCARHLLKEELRQQAGLDETLLTISPAPA